MRRVNVDAFREFVDGMSDEQLQRQNEADIARSKAEHAKFIAAYQLGNCYLCNKPFKTLSKSHPCVHWLLRKCKFKKKDFPLIYAEFGYVQIATFVRWVANQERFLGGINDLLDERSKRKVFEYTVKWRNIDWSFNCSKNDYEGHGGNNSSHPHYHLQMRIDSRPFVDFGDFHIPFSEADLITIDLDLALPDRFHHSFWAAGAGMQAAIKISPEDIVEHSEHTENEDEATYRLLTTIRVGDKAISGKQLYAIFEENKRTGATLASLARKHLPDVEAIRTLISPADSVPEIARRTERKRR